MPGQNLKFSMSLIPTPDVNSHVLYAGAKAKRKTVTTLPPQKQYGD